MFPVSDKKEEIQEIERRRDTRGRETHIKFKRREITEDLRHIGSENKF